MTRKNKGRGAPVAVAYLRVSTDEDRQELGAEAQRAAIAAWSAKAGIPVAAWHLDEVSGGAPLAKRPALVEAVADVEARGGACLIVARLDRFSRDRLETAAAELALRRCGADLVCADGAGSGDDPAAALLRTILLGVAEFEKASIRARIKAALAVKRARGEMTGAAPFGQRTGADGKTLEPEPAELDVVARARALRAAGETVRDVAASLAGEGVVGRTGKPLTLAAVHKLLTRKDPS